MNALQQNELEELALVDTEKRERFKITDLSSLNWVLRKLDVINLQKQEINKLVDDEIGKLEHFRNNKLSEFGEHEMFFHSLIEEYAAEQREKDPEFRVVTPYGTVSYRKQQPDWNYADEKLLEYLERNELNDYIRIKKEPNKVEIKKKFKLHNGQVVDENGQVVEGITVSERPAKLVVKVGD